MENKESWKGICEDCNYAPVAPAEDEAEALELLNQIHQRERKDCKGEILVAFTLEELASTGQY